MEWSEYFLITAQGFIWAVLLVLLLSVVIGMIKSK